MGNTGVIDHFLEVFTRYIDSGFGLLSGEVAFIATTLIVIDVTLAALFWSWGADDDILARLVKKTLFVGVFAYITHYGKAPEPVPLSSSVTSPRPRADGTIMALPSISRWPTPSGTCSRPSSNCSLCAAPNCKTASRSMSRSVAA